MLWQKNGKIYQGGGVVVDGMRHFNPSPEQFIAAGYTEYVPPVPEPAPAAPKRYSKLKVIRALGERWPEYKAGLEANGLLDQFMAAAYLDESDPAFAAALATLTDAEREALEECRYE